MNLLVDIGNSRIKWAHHSGCQLINHGNNFYQKDCIDKCLDASWDRQTVPNRIMVANVGGKKTADIVRDWSVRKWNIEPEFAQVTKSAFGVVNAYDDVDRLGVDRWMALLAVWQKYRTSACIIDCGTAITVDALNTKGEHLGGLILPGIGLMQNSLVQHTMLEHLRENQEITLMARNTEQAIQSGCMFAVVGLINHVITELKKSAGQKLHCIITGGDANKVKTLLADNLVYEPYIILEGLAILAGNTQ